MTLAANALLNNMVLLAAYFLDGFATAAEQICGQAVGARDRTTFRAGLRMSLGWGFGFACVASLLYLLAGPHIIDLMTTSPEVRGAARISCPSPPCCRWWGSCAYAFDGIYIGALWSRDMRNLMVGALAAYLVAWLLLRPLGNAGLWLALPRLSRGAGRPAGGTACPPSCGAPFPRLDHRAAPAFYSPKGRRQDAGFGSHRGCRSHRPLSGPGPLPAARPLPHHRPSGCPCDRLQGACGLERQP